MFYNTFYGKSSEKSPQPQKSDSDKPHKEKQKKVLLPSLKYPNAPLIERDVDFAEPPNCSCCNHKMIDSGMTENSEYLTVVPAQYVVIRQKRHKYRCGKCHGDLQTAPALPRIVPGSVYSDEMIVDVALTKYCDLIPIERYTAIAGRSGLEGLPQNSLIDSTHKLADFVQSAHIKLKNEVISSPILFADETPHRMLEGDDKSNWFLWGFSTPIASYYEAHNTRSGSVASNLLINSQCEYLVSDVYSGYNKSVRDTNETRNLLNLEKNLNLPTIKNIYCNAHARRKFHDALDHYPDEAQFFIDQYQEIYKLNGLTKDKPPNEVLMLKTQMKPFFEAMKCKAMELFGGYPAKSAIGKALAYFLRNYNEFTAFINHPDLPIDNNAQERLLRNPVIGRKTWYGTHSKRGAQTAVVLFSLVESCKLNKINPREYFKNLVQDLHQGKSAYTPKEFKDLHKTH